MMHVKKTGMDTELICIKGPGHTCIFPLLSHMRLSLSLGLSPHCSRGSTAHILTPVVLHYHELFLATAEYFKLPTWRKQER